MPDTMSSELKDLILKLLAKEPERRFGHKGAEEVKSHPFFKGIHWEDVLKKRLRPPFVPTLTSQQDVRYFRDVTEILKKGNMRIIVNFRLGILQRHQVEV